LTCPRAEEEVAEEAAEETEGAVEVSVEEEETEGAVEVSVEEEETEGAVEVSVEEEATEEAEEASVEAEEHPEEPPDSRAPARCCERTRFQSPRDCYQTVYQC